LTSPLTLSFGAVPSDVKPPMGEPRITKAVRGGAGASRVVPNTDDEADCEAEELDEELDDEELIEELGTDAAGDTVRSIAAAVDSVPDPLPGFLLLRSLALLADIALISIAVCLL